LGSIFFFLYPEVYEKLENFWRSLRK
jgi:hypothetical protein